MFAFQLVLLFLEVHPDAPNMDDYITPYLINNESPQYSDIFLDLDNALSVNILDHFYKSKTVEKESSDVNIDDKSFDEQPSSTDCSYPSTTSSPFSISSLEDADAIPKEEAKNQSFIQSTVPSPHVLQSGTKRVDTMPISIMINENIKKKSEGPLPKKVCIGDSVPTTTPFLLMQKMLRGETDLKLPPGEIEKLSYFMITEMNLQSRS